MPYMDPIITAVVLGAVGIALIAGIIIRRYRFLQSLRASVIFDIKKFAKNNQPISSESDWISILLGILYIPLLLFLLSPVLQLSLFMDLVLTIIAVLLVIFGLFGQHMVISDSYSGRTNLLAIVDTVMGWDLVFMAKMFMKPIIMDPDTLAEVKQKSIEFSSKNAKLKDEINEFWKSEKYYPILAQKYTDSMRDAAIIVTNRPSKEALREELRAVAAGIKTLNISVAALKLSYTSAVEMMSSVEHKKSLNIDKVEVPIFTSIFTNMTAEAQKNISAAALESMRASDERIRRLDAEARANKLQERNNELLKSKNIDKRQQENERLKGLTESQPESKIRVVKKHWMQILLIIVSVLAALSIILWWFK